MSSVETDIRNDVTWLKGRIAQLEAEAQSIWAKAETYGYVIGALVLGLVIGHFV